VHSPDAGGTNAPWGELMSTLAKRSGAAGCVCDSQIRDCVRIIDMGFPVYYAGIRPLDSMGRARVMAYDVPVSCGGVLVQPNDIIFADFDGVVCIPRQVAEQVVTAAKEKAGKENASRKELIAGKTLRAVYDKYKVL
jgi:regulator of RNase E activity RraA